MLSNLTQDMSNIVEKTQSINFNIIVSEDTLNSNYIHW